MNQFISVEEAQATISAHLSITPIETVALESSLGRTLGGPIASSDDIPPFDNSAMDGFAVRVQDLTSVPMSLPVSMEIPAGHHARRALEPSSCARIMTGAPLPEGADTIVPVEWTTGDNPVEFQRIPDPGNSVRRAGEDVTKGQTVFTGGEIVTPPVVGMLAALGIGSAPVRRPPSCSIIATGDELVPHSTVPGEGQIRNSNGPALAAQVTLAGGRVARVQTARDNPDSLGQAIEESLNNDIIILSGGVSVGVHDYVLSVLDGLGVQLLFWKVRQRPGKPLLFGVSKGSIIFGLPGNPVSSSICFDRYVRTSIARMLGRARVERPRSRATLTAPMAKVAGLRYFARGFLSLTDDGSLQVAPTGPQGSGIYSSMAHADCIIHLPEVLEDPGPGTLVEVEPLTW